MDGGKLATEGWQERRPCHINGRNSYTLDMRELYNCTVMPTQLVGPVCVSIAIS